MKNRYAAILLPASLLLAACGSSTPVAGTALPTAPVVVDAPAAAPDRCTDADSPLDPACFVQGNAASIVREVCNVQWLPVVCDSVAFDEPGYAVTEDPTPGAPLFLAVGAVHEHSGYSDGDPQMIPRDYFAAARTGQNTDDDGSNTGIRLDFMMSSEHTDNEKLPVTTAAACIPVLINCANLQQLDHYFKWQAALRQAREGSDAEFTALRGFEWTNDYFNHLNVYLSTNVVNAKTDLSYLSMNFFWNWLAEPVIRGGGADALVTFNHPGKNPALTPFDGDTPLNELLALLGNANWDDLAYVAAADANVFGIEVNGGDDIEWYIKALQRGWHLGPVAAEDEHQRGWSSSKEGKTLVLTRGRSPQDYYYALRQQRTAVIHHEWIEGEPGEKARFPTVLLYANGDSVQSGVPMGSVISSAGVHTLHVEVSGAPAGSPVVLIGSGAGQSLPIPLGNTDGSGKLQSVYTVMMPASGEEWYFVVACAADELACGSNQNHRAVTAPIWFTSGS